jgi:hypothetical protein
LLDKRFKVGWTQCQSQGGLKRIIYGYW